MTIAESSAAGPHSFEEYDAPRPVFLGGAIDQIVELADREIDPDWLSELAELVVVAEEAGLIDGARIAAEPEAIADALTCTYTDPEMLENSRQVPARALVLMMRHLSRMASWAQATQTTLMAAFSRPGVAVPLDEVMEAVLASLSSSGIEVDENAVVRATSTRAVVGDDAWDLTVADQAGRIAAAELGPALNLTPITARNRVVEAQTFADDLPLTHERWRQGRLDRVRATIIADRTAVLDRAGKADVEHRLLGDGAAQDAGRLTPGRLRSAVDRAVIQADPDAARRRSEHAHRERSVHVTPREDDMARFSADVRSPIALLAREVLDTAARNLPAECRGDRTLPQLRADVFGDIITSLATHGRVDIRCPAEIGPGPDGSGPGLGTGPGDCGSGLDGSERDAVPSDDHAVGLGTRPEFLALAWVPLGSSVAVTVAASTLAGLDNNPALLAGHGCITADLARALALRPSRRHHRRTFHRSTTADNSARCCPPGAAADRSPAHLTSCGTHGVVLTGARLRPRGLSPAGCAPGTGPAARSHLPIPRLCPTLPPLRSGSSCAVRPQRIRCRGRHRYRWRYHLPLQPRSAVPIPPPRQDLHRLVSGAAPR